MHVRAAGWTFAAVYLLGLGPAPDKSSAQSVTGIARNIDGDSLRVGDREVRLFGIDAPEWGQVCNRDGQPWDCGAAAAGQLEKLVTGKPVRCTPVDTDEYGRTVAQCAVGNIDVNRAMVASGYAVAYRRYSTTYVSAEESAKANRRGLWAGTFEMPSLYRHDRHGRPQRESRSRTSLRISVYRGTSTPAGPCNIKGNHSRRGEWIYHLPGTPYYEQTRAEQMFCSEAEARAAGYRRSRAH
jgi:endonuclease YncB( thermonuclease family)